MMKKEPEKENHMERTYKKLKSSASLRPALAKPPKMP